MTQQKRGCQTKCLKTHFEFDNPFRNAGRDSGIIDAVPDVFATRDHVFEFLSAKRRCSDAAPGLSECKKRKVRFLHSLFLFDPFSSGVPNRRIRNPYDSIPHRFRHPGFFKRQIHFSAKAGALQKTVGSALARTPLRTYRQRDRQPL